MYILFDKKESNMEAKAVFFNFMLVKKVTFLPIILTNVLCIAPQKVGRD